MTDGFFEIPYYHDYISPSLARNIFGNAKPFPGIAELIHVGDHGGLETQDSLKFLVELYLDLKEPLGKVLNQRKLDRKFIDERCNALAAYNREMGWSIDDPNYKTVLDLVDANGRTVFGALRKNFMKAGGKSIAPLPEFLNGPHVTLFGPPDSAKLAINAMNSFHRKMSDEPEIVASLLGAVSPMWGADDEDSKTPLRSDLIDAGKNLSECFKKTLRLSEENKTYELAPDHLALPIKRFPGLALPCTFLFYRENPIPLHLYDFALHLFEHWNNPQALVFYVPKLENEEEARYIHQMIFSAEARIARLHPEYQLGTVRLMVVLENPRAILRTHEIMDSLYPYFAGASLGWHDYLASTARLFREDQHYRIPVKADPEIVIKYIKASHHLLADVVGSRGGIKVGGMYGILPLVGDPASLQTTLKGFFKDVLTQMKRNLTGFWVAHPDFVRLGLAIVEGWRRFQTQQDPALFQLIAVTLNEEYCKEITAFVTAEDIVGLNSDDPGYVRSLIVADIKESDFIPNNHPDEIRYNVFQTLQYLTDWLSGNGCVALPSLIQSVPVRVMDDLATAERSRWELWHELHHGRFSIEDFLKIVAEEMNFIRRDLSNQQKIVQVKWNERTEKWYPIAEQLLLLLTTKSTPVEFATELLMPFTVESIRENATPLAKLKEIDQEKYRLDKYVHDFQYYFELCGCARFASAMAQNVVQENAIAREVILSFSLEEIKEAAGFHGDIGAKKIGLDQRALAEQAKVLENSEDSKKELRELGERYLKINGFKFLISARDKSAQEIKAILEKRLQNLVDREMQNARAALLEITLKRMDVEPFFREEAIDDLRRQNGIRGVSLSINYRGNTQTIVAGESGIPGKALQPGTWFEFASLSKTVAAAITLKVFQEKNLTLDLKVNEFLKQKGSPFSLICEENPAWAEAVTVEHLLNHTALNLHYMPGISSNLEMPSSLDLLHQNKQGYPNVKVLVDPGATFQYSGGGFLVLEHLLELLLEKPVKEFTRGYLDELGLNEISFDFENQNTAHGTRDDGSEIPNTRLNFPALAAGGFGSSRDFARFLKMLAGAYSEEKSLIDHSVAVQMLSGSDKGSRAFMGCDMGLGVFVLEGGANRWAVHQGANDGFRSLYMQCFAGPDRGKGFVVFCNSDNRAVVFISQLAVILLRELAVSGVDFNDSLEQLDLDAVKQEEIVNRGYKHFIFENFKEDLPEKIQGARLRSECADLNVLANAEISFVSNQKFALAENLISFFEPIFDPEQFGRQGKVMDSWETERHNLRGFDELVLKLNRASKVRFLFASTKFHDGNHPVAFSVEGKASSGEWMSILEKTAMQGHAFFKAVLPPMDHLFVFVRVRIFPDGGFSRLALYESLPATSAALFSEIGKAQFVRYAESIPRAKKPMTLAFDSRDRIRQKHTMQDLACAAAGGRVVGASNEHYGPAVQVISPFAPIHMFDGLESARSRTPGHSEWVEIELARPSRIQRVHLDFRYFVNNNPVAISIEAWDVSEWILIVAKTRVKVFRGNWIDFAIHQEQQFSRVRVTAFPDGGINRIRVFGET